MRRDAAGAAVACLVALALAPSGAQAHAELDGASPPDGATVRTLPETIRLSLNEPVAPPAFVVLTGPDGRRLQASDVQVEGPAVVLPLQVGGPAGEYTVDYRIVSTDGHPVTGSLTFTTARSSLVQEQPKRAAGRGDGTAGASTPTETSAPSSEMSPSRESSWLDSRWGVFLAGAIGLGIGVALLSVGFQKK